MFQACVVFCFGSRCYPDSLLVKKKISEVDDDVLHSIIMLNL